MSQNKIKQKNKQKEILILATDDFSEEGMTVSELMQVLMSFDGNAKVKCQSLICAGYGSEWSNFFKVYKVEEK